jgi:hypothetical protein
MRRNLPYHSEDETFLEKLFTIQIFWPTDFARLKQKWVQHFRT